MNTSRRFSFASAFALTLALPCAALAQNADPANLDSTLADGVLYIDVTTDQGDGVSVDISFGVLRVWERRDWSVSLVPGTAYPSTEIDLYAGQRYFEGSYWASQVDRIVFTGSAGGDYFDNETSIPCEAYMGGGSDYAFGGDGDDIIDLGTGPASYIVGWAEGRGGDDRLGGGDTNSAYSYMYLFGGDGNDRMSTCGLLGNTGDIGSVAVCTLGLVAHGGNGADYIYGNDGVDYVRGNDGKDEIHGNGHNDYLQGGNNADVIYGGSGADTVKGAGGDDKLYGGPGWDKLFGGGGDDKLDGGDGYDKCRGDSGNNKKSSCNH